MTTYTDQEKLTEVDREILMRERVYRWQVRNGKLTAEQAQRRIELMYAIKYDYEARLESVH